MKATNLKLSLLALLSVSLGALIYHFAAGVGSLKQENAELRRLVEKPAATLGTKSAVPQKTANEAPATSTATKSDSSDRFTDYEAIPDHVKSQAIREFLKDNMPPQGRARSPGGRLLSQMQVFDSNGELTDVFSQLFGLSEGERRELSRQSEQIRQDYLALAQTHSNLTHFDDGSVRLEIDPFEGGAELYSRLLDAFEDVMGSDRFSDFMLLGERNVSESFNQFGGEKLDILVTPKVNVRVDDAGNTIEEPVYGLNMKKEGANTNLNYAYDGLSEQAFAEQFGLVKGLLESAEKKP